MDEEEVCFLRAAKYIEQRDTNERAGATRNTGGRLKAEPPRVAPALSAYRAAYQICDWVLVCFSKNGSFKIDTRKPTRNL